MKLSKVMPEGMIFPYDFGFVPGTEAEDGDPLDILLLSDAPTLAGCEVECRLVGILKAEQKEEGKTIHNDRIIAVGEVSVLYAEVKEISQLEPALLHQIEEFFVNYQKVRGVEYKMLAREGSRSARELVSRSRKADKAAWSLHPPANPPNGKRHSEPANRGSAEGDCA